MRKSVYSLVLSDEVVAAVDRVAYEHCTSRSNMINQILAEYVSYVTPEKRMRAVLDETRGLLMGSGIFQLMMQPSESIMALRSALAYKYNPTVRYSIELYRNTEGGRLGELKVSLRSQNQTLLIYLNEFFKLWIQIEDKLLSPAPDYRLENGRYTRILRLPADSQTGASESIASYIRLFDSCLKTYFALLDTPQAAMSRIIAEYQSYLQTN